MMIPLRTRIAGFLGALLLGHAAVSAAETLPNIILIVADDLGYGDLGCYGAKGYQTPHLDQLAAKGRRFTNFHVAQAVCTASRAAILTGCYPNRVGLSGALGPGSKIGLHPDETTIAEVLRQKGYATAAVGKWHLGDAPKFLPTAQGFDSYFGLPYSNDMWPRHPEAKPGTFPPLPLMEQNAVLKPDLQPEDQEQLTTQYTERSIQFIEAHRSKPFFLYLAHSMPHVPLYVSSKFKGKTERGLFGDVIEEIDWSVGQIVETLRRLHLEENTLLVFTSDNGPWLSYGEHAGSAAPLREGKGTSWEGGTRVPCILTWPGHVPAGTTSDALLMTIDLLPSLAHVTQAPVPTRKIDGLNAWPLFSGTSSSHPHDAYFVYYGRNELQAVLTPEWKLVLPHQYRTLGGQTGGKNGIPGKYSQVKLAAPELYDLRRDPSEKQNVADQFPEPLRKLLNLAEKARADLGDDLTGTKGTGIREPGRL
jgi:arylsulfatase A